MSAYIKWSNGHITKVNAYFNENANSFEARVFKAYGNCDCRILLNIEGEGFYIK